MLGLKNIICYIYNLCFILFAIYYSIADNEETLIAYGIFL